MKYGTFITDLVSKRPLTCRKRCLCHSSVWKINVRVSDGTVSSSKLSFMLNIYHTRRGAHQGREKCLLWRITGQLCSIPQCHKIIDVCLNWLNFLIQFEYVAFLGSMWVWIMFVELSSRDSSCGTPGYLYSLSQIWYKGIIWMVNVLVMTHDPLSLRGVTTFWGAASFKNARCCGRGSLF